MKRLSKIDKTYQFNNKNEESFYKLAVGHDIFFKDSLPEPLSHAKLAPYKASYNSMTVLNLDDVNSDPIHRYDYLSQYNTFHHFTSGLA